MKFVMDNRIHLKKLYIGNIKDGAPRRSRTPNLPIRSRTLYPIELWAQQYFNI